MSTYWVGNADRQRGEAERWLLSNVADTNSMQYPEQVWQSKVEPPKETETDAIEVLKFLDRMEAKHGKKSVMYCRYVQPLPSS
jgi:GH25 family lysozyme M1 (1,4-beta-N-acetylmuramidase)